MSRTKKAETTEGKKLRTMADLVESVEKKGLRLMTGHTYEFKEAGSLVGGEKFKCDLCGGIGKNYITLMDETGGTIKVGYTCLKRPGLKVINAPEKSGKRGRPKSNVEKVVKPKMARKEAKEKVEKKPVRDRAAETLKTAVAKKTGASSKKVNVVKEEVSKVRDKKIDELLSDI